MPDDGAPRTDSIAIPVRFLETVAPEIREIAELQVMLAMFRVAAESRDIAAPVLEESLMHDPPLSRALRMSGASRPPREAIRHGIDLALARDSLLRFVIGVTAEDERVWLMLSTPANRRRLEQLRKGDTASAGLPETSPGARVRVERPNVFVLYEQNIGMVTPLIADQLIEAMEVYPRGWIEDAIAEAVGYNRRNWRYVQRILQNWATEGRGNETAQRHQRASGSFDPDRLLHGEHAALFRRRR
jgi:DNA replication protein